MGIRPSVSRCRAPHPLTPSFWTSPLQSHMLHQCRLSPLDGPKGASYGQSSSQTQTTPAQITFSITHREGDTGSDSHWVSENKTILKTCYVSIVLIFATFLLSLKILPGILSLIQCLTWFQMTNPASFKIWKLHPSTTDRAHPVLVSPHDTNTLEAVDSWRMPLGMWHSSPAPLHVPGISSTATQQPACSWGWITHVPPSP